ncbi:MAG: LON peptidase substrate-binding domain-containing protein [Actinomycetes bacterium]
MIVPGTGEDSSSSGDLEFPESRELALFPLGSVLLPGMALQLHLFEPRYRVLMHDLQHSESAEFGVVLIDRGSEVGGGETRGGVGCRAVISQAVEQLDGSWAVVAIGTERLHVTRWLEDDPYPRALVAVWADSDADQRQDPSRLSLAERIARRVFALAVEMGAQGDLSSIELSSDPSSRVYQLATLAPLGALDRRRLLATPDLTTRLELLVEMLEEQELLLQGRLSLGE